MSSEDRFDAVLITSLGQARHRSGRACQIGELVVLQISNSTIHFALWPEKAQCDLPNVYIIMVSRAGCNQQTPKSGTKQPMTKGSGFMENCSSTFDYDHTSLPENKVVSTLHSFSIAKG